MVFLDFRGCLKYPGEGKRSLDSSNPSDGTFLTGGSLCLPYYVLRNADVHRHCPTIQQGLRWHILQFIYLQIIPYSAPQH